MAFRRFVSVAPASLVLGCALLVAAASSCSDSDKAHEGDDADSSPGGEGGETSPDPIHNHPSGGSTGGGAGGQGGLGSGGEGTGIDDGCEAHNVCSLVECSEALAVGNHVAVCSPLSPATNPPTSGEHYPVWAAYAVYDEPVPRGFWIHSIEHSGVALTYNCERAEAQGMDCAQLAAQLSDFFDDWPADPLCTSSRHRLLVTKDPELDAVFAASAWGYSLKGDCFDAEVVSAFISKHYGMNYENICAAGVDPFTYPADCGM